MRSTILPSRRLHSPCLSVVFALVLLCGMHLPGLAQEQAERTTAGAGRVQITVEPGLAADATTIADAYGEAITTAWPQFTALFGTEPFAPQHIAFVGTLDPAAMTGMRWVTDFAWASPDGTVAIVALDPFLALTPIEAGNLLRNLTSRGFVQAAAGNAIPLGLLDGIARYVELPIQARQARLGSLVQGLHQAGTLPGWNQIVTGVPSALSAEERTATGYALVAFLVDRYGVAGLRNLVTGFSETTAWEENLQGTLGQAPADLATAWERFLPRWFASGWRDNAVSAFDLTRAERLFDRGAYEASSAEAERSQRLFLDLGDEAGLSRVEALLAQNAVGLQADAMMADAQAALEAHDYATAQGLVDQAVKLYALLPEEHHPSTLIDRYTEIASQGMEASALLAQADVASGSWLEVTSARADAVTAGDMFATLGNSEGTAAADAVVSDIDERITRMLFVLSALVVVLAAWLGAWLWLRAPSRLQWRSQVPARAAARMRTGG